MIQLGATYTLVSDYTVYFSEDPAIDKEHEGFDEIWEEYISTGDPSKVPMKPGQEPTVWKMRHIRGKAKRMVQDMIRKTAVDDMISPTAAYLACQIALVEASNLIGRDGREFELNKTFDKDLRFNVVSEETMQVLDQISDGQLVNQLGIRAIMNLSLSPL